VCWFWIGRRFKRWSCWVKKSKQSYWNTDEDRHRSLTSYKIGDEVWEERKLQTLSLRSVICGRLSFGLLLIAQSHWIDLLRNENSSWRWSLYSTNTKSSLQIQKGTLLGDTFNYALFNAQFDEELSLLQGSFWLCWVILYYVDVFMYLRSVVSVVQ